ncbi:MAG: hypothetical protein PHP64_03790 [Actinomycetota bacterium]|nr:hypothetical protein [Actinomycetota bacterium]
MRKLLIALTILFLLIFPQVSLASDTIPIKRIISNMKEYDGKIVTVEGEAIGDKMIRGSYGWITVNDDPYSIKSLEEGGKFKGLSNMGIGVWAPVEELEDITILGGYKNKGDKIRVRGYFHRACHEHGGDTDIHAISIEKIKDGHPFSKPFEFWKLALSLILFGFALLLWKTLNIKKSKAKGAKKE